MAPRTPWHLGFVNLLLPSLRDACLSPRILRHSSSTWAWRRSYSVTWSNNAGAIMSMLRVSPCTHGQVEIFLELVIAAEDTLPMSEISTPASSCRPTAYVPTRSR